MAIDHPDDVVLVRAAQRGDREAFGELVSRHGPAVLSVTTRMLGHGGEAEDVAQDAFVAAYRGLARFQFEARFSTWLYRIAVNKCTDALRARRPSPVSLDARDDDADTWEPADADTPHFELEQSELAGALDRALAALPPIYREAFVLKHVEGLGYEEMSTVLGVHRDTLKMRVYKARTRLCHAAVAGRTHLHVRRRRSAVGQPAGGRGLCGRWFRSTQWSGGCQAR